VIEVIDPGASTTVQDQGRPGYERYGISPGGACDKFSAAVANLLVGNSPDAAVLECTVKGPSLRVEQVCLIAVTGAGSRVVGWRPLEVVPGEVIDLGLLKPGIRSYVAVAGGIDVPVVLGSRSLCRLGRFGGGFGRPLHAGDSVPIGRSSPSQLVNRSWPTSHRPQLTGPWEIPVIPGPQLDAFPNGALARLLETAFRISSSTDRMGMRLEGRGFRVDAQQIVTTPVVAGAIQVTSAQEVIVLMPECQPTGGYPVIACVIDAAIPMLAQARPGDTIHFKKATLGDAARARSRLDGWLRQGSRV
jgi:antagonist of KipI